MRKVTFEISENDYALITKKLNHIDLSWRMILKQFIGFLKSTEALDDQGLPLQEISSSYFKRIKARLEGPLENTMVNYIKLKASTTDSEKNFYIKKIKNDLAKISMINSSRRLNRGYCFDHTELNKIIKELWIGALTLAHNDPDAQLIRVKRPSYQVLLDYKISNSKSKPLTKSIRNKNEC